MVLSQSLGHLWFYETEGVHQAIKILVKPQGNMGNNKESWEGVLARLRPPPGSDAKLFRPAEL